MANRLILPIATAVLLGLAGSAAAQGLSLSDLQSLNGLTGAAGNMAADGAGGGDGQTAATVIQLFGLLSVLAVAPGILITVTSFTRFIVVFSIMRSGLGLQSAPANLILISLALFMTWYVMEPVADRAWREGVQPLMANEITQEEALPRIAEPFREFMQANVRDEDLALFADLTSRSEAQQQQNREGEGGFLDEGPLNGGSDAAPGGRAGFGGMDERRFGFGAFEPQPGVQLAQADLGTPPAIGDGADTPAAEEAVPYRILVPAYMISELRRGFEIGFLVVLPFLVIDLVVATITMAMGMMMLPPTVLALPFKILFFVLIDGWNLLVGSMVRSFL